VVAGRAEEDQEGVVTGLDHLGGAIAPEAWDAATDPDCPPGVVRFSGQPFPLVEFMEDRDD
jgi:hypothetical protein